MDQEDWASPKSLRIIEAFTALIVVKYLKMAMTYICLITILLSSLQCP